MLQNDSKFRHSLRFHHDQLSRFSHPSLQVSHSAKKSFLVGELPNLAADLLSSAVVVRSEEPAAILGQLKLSIVAQPR